MASGLEWNESEGIDVDVTKMLFEADDSARYAQMKGANHIPQSIWEYASGTSNILSKSIRNIVKDDAKYYSLLYDSIFHKLGMHTAIIEVDGTGTLVGSSFGWATTRDWAKLGLLYLNDGKWNGDNILPEGWVEYTTTPTPASHGKYGAHWWLNKGQSLLPDVPEDVFMARGFQGQRIYVIPNKNAVIVRLGIGDEDVFDFNTFVHQIIVTL